MRVQTQPADRLPSVHTSALYDRYFNQSESFESVKFPVPDLVIETSVVVLTLVAGTVEPALVAVAVLKVVAVVVLPVLA